MSPLSKCEQLGQQLPELSLVHDESLAAPNIIKEIHELSNEALFGGTIEDSDMAQAARAGLLLEAGGWDDAHRIVQELDTPEAQYWHSIVHRREPDSSNAKYWFRQVGHHPVMAQLLSILSGPGGPDKTLVQRFIKSEKWDPFKYVDVCMACHQGTRKELLPILLDIQKKEFTSLLDYCIQHALGVWLEND
ncbi:MAG: hypothetical protein JSU59_06885 [Nitrospirota bacterium]|nr:MAG: hypothetical protein JSU59_06885 [Nitrospirota bacterium]